MQHHYSTAPSYRRWRIAAVAMLAAVGGCGGGGPDDSAVVADAWAVPVGDGTAAAVYATITATTDDELTGAHVDREVARRAGVVDPDDTATGQPGHLGHLDPGGALNDDHSHTVALRPDTPVTLEPGRSYLALDLLATPLQPGDTFEITLTFDDSPDVRTQVTVRPPPA
jgi:copper(I)-binding protein